MRLASVVRLSLLTLAVSASGLPTVTSICPLTPAIVSAAAAEVSTPEAFTQALYQQLLARQENFSILYQGNYADVYDGDLEALMQRAYALHQPGNSDDYDYLQHNIATYQLTLPAISDTTEFVFTITYREPKGWLDVVNQDAASLLPSLKGATDYETIRNIHDYIVNHITYDNSLTRATAYQGLEEQSTICQGYALLTYKLLTDAGIPCRFVSGYAGESHAWNIVELDGKWYYLDTTWDDPVGSSPQLTYDYFLVGSDKLSQDHTLDPAFQTADFQSGYPISATDYSPDTATQAPAVTDTTATEQADASRRIRQAIISALDDETGPRPVSATERQLNDLAKQIMIGILTNQSNENLLKLVNDTALFNQYIDQAYQKVEACILQPIDAYEGSTAYKEECARQYETALTRTDLQHMDPAVAARFKTDLEARIADTILQDKIRQISARETEPLIKEITQSFTEKP